MCARFASLMQKYFQTFKRAIKVPWFEFALHATEQEGPMQLNAEALGQSSPTARAKCELCRLSQCRKDRTACNEL